MKPQIYAVRFEDGTEYHVVARLTAKAEEIAKAVHGSKTVTCVLPLGQCALTRATNFPHARPTGWGQE